MPIYKVKVVVNYEYEVEADNEQDAQMLGWEYASYAFAASVYSIDVQKSEALGSDLLTDSANKASPIFEKNILNDGSSNMPNPNLTVTANSKSIKESEIDDVIFSCLCNYQGIYDRRDSLVPEHISLEEFERYINWWWKNPNGISIFENLANEVKESICEFWPLSQEEALEIFLAEFKNWEDFLRELRDCTLEDLKPNSAGNENCYFTEYVVLNSMRIFNGDEEFSEYHEVIIQLLEEWFENCQEEISLIFARKQALICQLFSKLN